MELFAEYLAGIDNSEHRTRLEDVLVWVAGKYPGFETKVAWNQLAASMTGISAVPIQVPSILLIRLYEACISSVVV